MGFRVTLYYVNPPDLVRDSMRQIHLPAARLWVGVGPRGVHVLRQGREWVTPMAALSVLLGPGQPMPRILAHAADGTLWDVTGVPARRYLDAVIACDGDPIVLAAARPGPILHLESGRSCTTLALPEEPRMIQALGATQTTPHLALVVLQGAAWLVAWAEKAEEVQLQQIVAGAVTDALLLAGNPALVLVRMSRGSHDRLLSWQVVGAGGGLELCPLPPLLLATDVPTAARNPAAGPFLLAGQATWMALQSGQWDATQAPPPDGPLPTRIFAGIAAMEPLWWQGQKQHTP